MDGDEVAKLQRIVNEDKARRRNDEATTSSADPSSMSAAKGLPRKSSLKVKKHNGRANHVQYDDGTEQGLQMKREHIVKDDDPMTT